MLKLLLDEHISSDVAEALRVQSKTPAVWGLAEFEGGRLIGLSDEVILQAAAARKLTLVTYDRKTIPPILKALAEAGQNHGGVIFVDEKTISPSDIGGLIRALHKLLAELSRTTMNNAVIFLRRETRR